VLLGCVLAHHGSEPFSHLTRTSSPLTEGQRTCNPNKRLFQVESETSMVRQTFHFWKYAPIWSTLYTCTVQLLGRDYCLECMSIKFLTFLTLPCAYLHCNHLRPYEGKPGHAVSFLLLLAAVEEMSSLAN